MTVMKRAGESLRIWRHHSESHLQTQKHEMASQVLWEVSPLITELTNKCSSELFFLVIPNNLTDYSVRLGRLSLQEVSQWRGETALEK